MKKILLLLGVFGCLRGASALPVYDPIADATAFGGSAYTPGDPLAWQTNAFGDAWYAAQTNNTTLANRVIITNGNLSYPNLPESSGNSVRLRNVGNGLVARMFVADTTAGFLATNVTATAYYSLLVQLEDIAALSTTGEYSIGFNNQGTLADQSGQPGIQGARLYFRRVTATTFNVGIAKNSAVVAWDIGEYNVGESLFVVAAYEIIYDEENPQPNDDNVRLWVNPPSASFGSSSPPAENASLTLADGQPDINSVLSAFQLQNRSGSAPNVTVVDDVRLGRTWRFVTGGPEIGVQPPANVAVGHSTDLHLTVSARSGGPSALTYRWQKDGSELNDTGNISGSATASLTVSNVTPADAGTYSVVVGNALTTVTNSPSVVTVVDPYVLVQPEDHVVAPGVTVQFSVTAAGTAPLSYNWHKDGLALEDGGTITGSGTATLTIASVSDTNVGAYSCLVSNGLGNAVLSEPALLTLVDPGITADPESLTLNYGATAMFSAVAVGTEPLSYRWQKDGVDLEDGPRPSGAVVSGAATTNLTVTGVSYLEAGGYSLVASNGLGASASSAAATLTVNDPYIITHPAGSTNELGTTAIFSVEAAGSAPLSYTWYHNNAPLSDGGNISGATTATLTVTNVSNANGGEYRVEVFGASGAQADSMLAFLKVQTTVVGLPLYWDTNGDVPGSGGGTGNWTDLNWSDDPLGAAPAGVWLDGSVAIFSAGDDLAFPFTVTVSGTHILTGLSVEEGSPTINSGTLDFANPAGQSELHAAGGVAAIVNTTVLTGTNDLIKTGPGSIRFNANNTYVGRTIIKEGTIVLQQDPRLGAVPATFVADAVTLDGGTMEWVNTGGQDFQPNRGFTITTNGGTFYKSASGNVNLNAVISGAGPLIRTGVNQFTFNADNTFTGPLIVRCDTQGNLTTLAGANHLSEGIQHESGELRLNAEGAAGSGIITVSPGATLRTTLVGPDQLLVVTNNIVTTGDGYAQLAGGGGSGANLQRHLELAGVIGGPGGIWRINVGDRRIILSGNNTYTGGTRISAGNIVAGHKNAFGTGTIIIGDQGPDQFPLDVGALFIHFNALFDMIGANAITNPIIAYQQFSMAITITNTALEFSGPVDLAADFDIRIFANYPTLVHHLSGPVSSSTGRGLAKHGVGTLILSGDNTYAGGTTVATGILRVNNTSGSGTGPGPVIVETRPGFDPATLGGSGTIAGNVSVLAGLVSPGPLEETAGKLTLHDGLSLAGSAGGMVWELAALKDDATGVAGVDFDQVAITGGTLALGSEGVLSLAFLAGTAPDPAEPFWQSAHTWTIIHLSGSAANPGGSNFASVQNATNSAGFFSTAVLPDGSISLEFTPAAAPQPVIGSISGDLASATISWNATSGVDYQVLYNTNLNTTNWLVLTNVTGAGGLLTITDKHGGDPQRFYRLLIP